MTSLRALRSGRLRLPLALTGERPDGSPAPWFVIAWRSALAMWCVWIGVSQFLRVNAGRLAPDGYTYYAAGQRLNAGHQLYRLQPGDLPIYLHPPYWSVPLLSPPFMAVIWRPLSTLPYQLAILIWVTAMAIPMLWAAYKIFVPSPLAVAAAAGGLAYLLGSGNIHGFLFATLAGLWVYRGRTWPAALLGVVTAAKVMPVVFVAWLASERRRRPLIAFALVGAACTIIGLIGAGWAATRLYPHILRTSAPQPVSLSYLTHISWLSAALTVVGTVAAALLRGRRSYQMAVITMVVFNMSGIGFAGGSVIVLLALARQAPEPVSSAPTATSPSRRLFDAAVSWLRTGDHFEYLGIVALTVVVQWTALNVH